MKTWKIITVTFVMLFASMIGCGGSTSPTEQVEVDRYDYVAHCENTQTGEEQTARYEERIDAENWIDRFADRVASICMVQPWSNECWTEFGCWIEPVDGNN